MVTMFALAAALCYGSADFLGGSAARRAPVLSVLGVSASAGAVIVLAVAAAAGGPPAAAGIAWGACGGAAGGIGLMFFYAGLAAGPMSVVAPLSALVSTVLPVGFALAAGERPGPLVYAGALICLGAVVLVSSGGGSRAGSPMGGPARGIWYGIAAGAAFGMFFVFLRNAGESGALWPVAVARIAGLVVVVIAAVLMRARPVHWRAGGGLFLAALMSGVLDAAANIWYVLATRAGLFGIAVVLTSLYSGVTVLLARVLLGERMRGLQRAGLALAAVGILLVTV
jgi:drug/metabolite transporter (DMT)-like permease